MQGTIVKVSSIDGSKSETRVDDQGRTVVQRNRHFAGQWRSARTLPDVLGRVIYQERPHYDGAPSPGTSFQYDSLDRITETVLPDWSSWTSSHRLFDAIHRDALDHLSLRWA